MWYHDFFYIIMGMSLGLIRLHESYIETGQVPQRFLIGGSGRLPGSALSSVPQRPAVVAAPNFLRP